MKLSTKQLEQIKKQYRLSPRETQIVELILQGVDSNSEIAKRLGLSTGTVKQYVHVLFARFHINSKTNLVIKIFESIHK
jgi:DNA-binding NarL/FixJ family response regulator